MIGAAHRPAATQTMMMQLILMTLLLVVLMVLRIMWCLSRAIRQIEKVEVKLNSRGRNIASWHSGSRLGRGHELAEICARVAGHARLTSSRSETARLRRYMLPAVLS